MVKNPRANAGTMSSTPVQEDFLEEEMATHSSRLAKSPEQSSLAGYSTRGCKESDMTEHAHTHI